jgi:hypothetical protein
MFQRENLRALPGRTKRLRQAMSDVSSYQANVRRCDRAVDDHVFAELTVGHRQADLTSRLRDVGVVDRFVSVGIADEYVRAH